jgi:hypothetical protein
MFFPLSAFVRGKQGEVDPRRHAGHDLQGLRGRRRHDRAAVPCHQETRFVESRIFWIHHTHCIPGKGKDTFKIVLIDGNKLARFLSKFTRSFCKLDRFSTICKIVCTNEVV